jgi:hypothetical protein
VGGVMIFMAYLLTIIPKLLDEMLPIFVQLYSLHRSAWFCIAHYVLLVVLVAWLPNLECL